MAKEGTLLLSSVTHLPLCLLSAELSLGRLVGAIRSVPLKVRARDVRRQARPLRHVLLPKHLELLFKRGASLVHRPQPGRQLSLLCAVDGARRHPGLELPRRALTANTPCFRLEQRRQQFGAGSVVQSESGDQRSDAINACCRFAARQRVHAALQSRAADGERPVRLGGVLTFRAVGMRSTLHSARARNDWATFVLRKQSAARIGATLTHLNNAPGAFDRPHLRLQLALPVEQDRHQHLLVDVLSGAAPDQVRRRQSRLRLAEHVHGMRQGGPGVSELGGYAVARNAGEGVFRLPGAFPLAFALQLRTQRLRLCRRVDQALFCRGSLVRRRGQGPLQVLRVRRGRR